MKITQRHLLLASLTALVMLVQGCVYPPYAFYQPRYGYRPSGYYQDERYLMPPRHVHRPRVDHNDRASDVADDYPPPARAGQSDARERESRRPDEDATPPALSKDPVPSAKSKGDIPVATKTSNPNRVRSPYPPHNELDVTGLPSGSLAKDPTTGDKFRVP